MSEAGEKTRMSVHQLFLAPDNPRFEEVDGEMEAIRALCSTENIEVLARDIQLHGVNPAARLIVMPIDPEEDDPAEDPFFVAEGNRRLCAIKLLHDPDLAPTSIRRQIKSYSEKWTPVEQVDVVIIRDEERRRFWMQRMHDGEQGGRGQKRWNSEQKTRFTGGGRHLLAQAVLDYAESQGYLGKDQRKGRISHMARLCGNAVMKEVLGLVVDAGSEDLHRFRPKSDFDFALSKILEETRDKELGSQAKKKDIDSFARDIMRQSNFSGEVIEPEPLVPVEEEEPGEPNGDGDCGTGESDGDGDGNGNGQGGRGRPRAPTKKKYIPISSDIEEALNAVDSVKLTQLYYSITAVNVRRHPQLIGVGIWSFLGSLASLMGADDNQSLPSFFARGRISKLGVARGADASNLNKVLDDLNRGGNLGKHHAVAGQFDPDQLITNFQAVEGLIAAGLHSVASDTSVNG